MAPRKKTRPAAKKAPVKHFTFQLSLSGMVGIALASFCLFLWMFLLGIWAGQIIISPCPSAPVAEEGHPATAISDNAATQDADSAAICVQPRERKKRISSSEPSLYQGP
ncbi:MAG: hypothetical protein D3904_06125 [Candidatus Electrothrix sp. EH2]|nr:hypothetical protein [Candidatus Electrothrix sp. EH2]